MEENTPGQTPTGDTPTSSIAAPEVTTQPAPKNETPVPPRTPPAVIITLLLIFPPAAWIVMWNDKTYHRWFAYLLFLSGIFSLLYIAVFYFSVGTQITALYNSLGEVTTSDPQAILVSIAGSIVFAILQILFAFFLFRYLKHHDALNKGLLFVSLMLLALSVAVSLIPVVMTIQSVYSITASF
jgi:hypothetical protein